MNWSTLQLFVRPRRASASTAALPLIVFAVLTTAVLSVAVIARMLWEIPDNGFGAHKILAIALSTLLLAPLTTLAASAARLSARRRNDRLSTLRLLGATSLGVRVVAIAESVIVTFWGAVGGIVLHLATVPLLRFFPLHGTTATPSSLWLPWWIIAGIVAAIVLVSALSAASGLRHVVISPLGVRTKTAAPRLSWWRVVAAVGIIGGALALLQLASPGWGAVAIVAAFSVAILAVMFVLGLAGPFLIALSARRRVARTQSASELIAARGVLESPAAAWRQVSGVALASFLVVPIGSMLGYLDAIQRSSSVIDTSTRLLFDDIRTVMLAAIVISFVLVACSVGVTQSAAVLERGELYVSLDRIGMPLSEMNRARRRGVLAPLWIASIGSALIGTAITFPVVAVATVTAPLFIIGVVLTLTLGVLIVLLAVRATAPVLRSVLRHPERAL